MQLIIVPVGELNTKENKFDPKRSEQFLDMLVSKMEPVSLTTYAITCETSTSETRRVEGRNQQAYILVEPRKGQYR